MVGLTATSALTIDVGDWSLYRSHRMALHGFWKTARDTLTGWLQRHTYPRVKLH